MSDSRTHQTVGAVSVGALALAKARSEDPMHLLLELIGGVVGGGVGGRLPDVFDPPVSRRHRGLAHGVVPAVAAGVALGRSLDGTQARLRTEAARRADLRRTATTAVERFWHALVELLCRIGAGALAGLLAGYGSHLALDGFTPAGLPLLA
ncbi:metal-dependent hydrolase [Myxococcota bacterium]